jgi:hypothetical protein
MLRNGWLCRGFGGCVGIVQWLCVGISVLQGYVQCTMYIVNVHIYVDVHVHVCSCSYSYRSTFT